MQQPLHIIDSRRDAEHGWKSLNNYLFAAQESITSLLLSELHLALPYYALAFARRSDGDDYMLVAMLGMHMQENLYVNPQGGWYGGYIPSTYRGYPFVMQQVADDDGLRGVLAFNLDSGLYLENPGQSPDEQRFFDENGKMQPLLKQLLDFMQETTVSRLLTETAVKALADAGLLQPWPLDIKNPDPERPLLHGLRCINRKALYTLDGDSLKTLHAAGALAVAYAQLFSMPRISLLLKLYNLKYAAHSQLTTPGPTEPIDSLFGDLSKGSMKFDWQNL